jgi:hypothetical protein
MNYYTTLQQNFIDIRKFMDIMTNNGISIFASSSTHTPSNCFFIGNILHYPVTIGLSNPASQGLGGVIGFLKAKIINNLDLGDNEYKIIDNPEALKQAGVRLSPQTIKMFKVLRLGNKIFDGNYNNNRGFKCRAEEVIKCLSFGYFAFPDDREFLGLITAHNYSLRSQVEDKRIPIETIYSDIIKHFNSRERNSWQDQGLGNRIANSLFRTMVDIDEDCVVKWRKPSKKSKWPYTLEHHWFCCQESPIAMAHYTMAGLIDKGVNYRETKEKLMLNLPIFTNIRTLDTCRKVLEIFFNNFPNVFYAHSDAMSRCCSIIQSFDWPEGVGKKYSRLLPPEMFFIKAALALGVMPKFYDSGAFDKFVPINGALHENSETIYFDLSKISNWLSLTQPTTSYSFLARQIIMLMYSTGLICLKDLEKILGLNFHDDLQEPNPNNSNTVQLRMSKNVVCCLPANITSSSVYSALTKYGIHKTVDSYPETQIINKKLVETHPDPKNSTDCF